MTRLFSVGALMCILLAAVLLAGLFRNAMIDTLSEVSERANVVQAYTALSYARGPLAHFLDAVNAADAGEAANVPLPAALESHLASLMTQPNVDRIKIYDARGVVVFSTNTDQHAREQPDNPGFVSAMRGEAMSKLVYRDTFNSFDQRTEDDNLVQVYLPVRRTPAAPVIGVFEVYSDVNDLVTRAERTEFLVIAGTVTVLLLLYSVLVLIVHRAGRAVAERNNAIRERTQSLEMLSAQLLTAQEAERKRLSEELHEGLAQNLSAAKLSLEELLAQPRASAPELAAATVSEATLLLEQAIADLRRLAVDLRPPSLDDLGVLAAIAAFCRQLQSVYSGLCIEIELRVAESEITAPLKAVVFRVVQEALRAIKLDSRIDNISVSLRRAGSDLRIEVVGKTSPLESTVDPMLQQGSAMASAVAAVRERALLSGAMFHSERGPDGRLSLTATWPS